MCLIKTLKALSSMGLYYESNALLTELVECCERLLIFSLYIRVSTTYCMTDFSFLCLEWQSDFERLKGFIGACTKTSFFPIKSKFNYFLPFSGIAMSMSGGTNRTSVFRTTGRISWNHHPFWFVSLCWVGDEENKTISFKVAYLW